MLGGIQPCSFIDFPGHIAAVLFAQGCNLRCRYCHNPQLVPSSGEQAITVDEALKFLESRRGKLTGVVLTGGEPLLHDGLCDFLDRIRSMGFALKLDTNGTCPGAALQLLERNLVDFAAVDVKLVPGADSLWLCGMENQLDPAVESLGYMVEAGIPCEARTTVVNGLHDRECLDAMARRLVSAGVRTWSLQPVESFRVLDSSTQYTPPNPDILDQVVCAAAALGLDASVRKAIARKSDL